MARSFTAAPTLLHSVSRLSTSPRRLASARSEGDLGVGERHALALLRELAQFEVELKGAEAHRRARLGAASAAGSFRRSTLWMRSSSSRGSNGLAR